jgi:hypothetical protein
MSPVTCEFFDRCNPPLPDETHWVSAKTPRQRNGGTGGDGRRVHP